MWNFGASEPQENKPGGMGPTVRRAVCRASAHTIWATCFAPMKWETWDPDVERLDDVSGPCETGTRCVFVMKQDGSRIGTELSEVESDRSLTFSGSAAGGLMKFIGRIDLTPVVADALERKPSTEIVYSFELQGVFGFLFTMFRRQLVVGGTEKGLENMVRLSEAAEASG